MRAEMLSQLRTIGVAFAALAASFSFSGSGASAQTSYVLICKPGGDMVAEIRAGAKVKLTFQGSGDAASNTPPSAGQCAWLDRGFRTGEPTVLDTTGDVSHAAYLADALIRGETLYVHVYNDGQGSMIVTRVGP